MVPASRRGQACWVVMAPSRWSNPTTMNVAFMKECSREQMSGPHAELPKSLMRLVAIL